MSDLNTRQPNDGTGNTTGSHDTVGGTTSTGVPYPIRVDSSGNIQIGGSCTISGTADVQGTQANSDVLSADPIVQGARAINPSSLPTAVSYLDVVYNAADTYGRLYNIQSDLNRTNDSVVSYDPTNTATSTSAAAASLVVRNSAGTLLRIIGYNAGGAQFIQVHDAAALPADTAVPAISIAAAATSNFTIEIPEGVSFANGIVVCNSSTVATKTIGAADCTICGIHRGA